MAAIFIILNFFFVALSAQELFSCPLGVGLTPWSYTDDSRDTTFQIRCVDGSPWKKRGITSTDKEIYTITLRSLGRGLRRQGFLYTNRFDSPIQLVSACISDVGVLDDNTWVGLKPGNVCRGNQWSSRLGSPFFVQSTDESGFHLKGWQVKNNPRPTALLLAQSATYIAGTVGADGLVACNFYMGLSGTLHIGMGVGQALPASESGLASYMGWYSVSATNAQSSPTAQTHAFESRACWPLAFMEAPGYMMQTTPNYIPPAEITGPVLVPSTQKYGSLDAVVQSFMTQTGGSLWNAQESAFTTLSGSPGATNARQSIGFPVVGYANFPKQQSDNGLGFQLGCDPSQVDETKFIFLTFWGGISLQTTSASYYEYFCYPDFRSANLAALTNWDYRAGCVLPVPPLATPTATVVYPAGMPSTPLINLVLKVTCQNVETRTPTPRNWPGLNTIPTEPFVPSSYTLVVEQCERRCKDADFQAALIREVERFALLDGHDGANVFIECVESPQCTETLDTIALNSRRGLKQSVVYATSIAYLMKILIVTRTVTTANYLMNAIRAGTLNAYGISAFSSILLIYTNPQGKKTALTVVPVTAADSISTWPNLGLAEWSGRCYIYGPCRVGGCDSGCNNGQIVKTSDFSGGDIYCLCNACAWSQLKHRTQYLFYSDKCVGSPTVADATTCCRNVMQDAVCWLVSRPELLESDLAFLAEGQWAYRPPNIGSVAPSPLRYDGPTSCSSGSSSPKGLLGLLGLLGIIPCCLCLLSLLLCFLRRKKREGDVHFATFDAGVSCAPAYCQNPSFVPVSYQ